MKPKEFKVNNMMEFQDMVDRKDFSISKAIVESIIRNVKSRRKNVHVLSVKCADSNTIVDITLEKDNFVDTLKENIKYFEEKEMYEECVEIHNAIETLSKK